MKQRIAIYIGATIIAAVSLAWSLSNGDAPPVTPVLETAVKRVPHVAPATMPMVAGEGMQAMQGVPAPPELPAEFSILRTHSAFGRGKGPAVAMGPMGGPDAGFVFKGVVQADNSFTAFVEEVASKNVMQVGVGEPVARGRIKSIDLDSLDYEFATEVKHIMVGQNLEGQTPPPPPPPTTMPSGPPGQGEQDGPPAGMQLPPGVTPEMMNMMRQQSRGRGRKQ